MRELIESLEQKRRPFDPESGSRWELAERDIRKILDSSGELVVLSGEWAHTQPARRSGDHLYEFTVRVALKSDRESWDELYFRFTESEDGPDDVSCYVDDGDLLPDEDRKRLNREYGRERSRVSEEKFTRTYVAAIKKHFGKSR